MTLRVMTEVDEGKWQEFLARTDSSNPFQTPEMMRVYAGTRGYTPHVVAVEARGQVQALLASVLIHYANGGLQRFATRAITQGGPIGDPSGFSVLIHALDSYASKLALLSEIRNINEPKDPEEFLAAGYSWQDHLDFSVDLHQGERSVWEGMSRSRKKGISKAMQSGLEISKLAPANLSDAYGLLQDTYTRSRVPLADASLFENAMKLLCPSGKLLALGAAKEGSLCAVRFLLRARGVMYDWYAGSSDIGRDLHADELLVWEAFKEGIGGGAHMFRFGGAGRPGEEYGPGEFKRRFGGRALNPGRFTKSYHPVASFMAHGIYRVSRRLS